MGSHRFANDYTLSSVNKDFSSLDTKEIPMYFFEERSSWALEKFFLSAGWGWNYLLGMFFLSGILSEVSCVILEACAAEGQEHTNSCIPPKTK